MKPVGKILSLKAWGHEFEFLPPVKKLATMDRAWSPSWDEMGSLSSAVSKLQAQWEIMSENGGR